MAKEFPDPVLDYIEQYVRHFGTAPSAEEIYAYIDPREPGQIGKMLASLTTYGARYHRMVQQRMAG